MPDPIESLKADLRRIQRCGRRLGVFGEEMHGFVLNPVRPEGEVAAFESAHGIRLPEEYRRFVTEIGDGGAGPSYGLFRLGEMDHGHGFGPWGDFVGRLDSPFPHERAWNDLTGQPDEEAELTDDEMEAQLDAFEARYYDTRLTAGAIPICHLGCALRHWLVVTGPEAGHVWHDGRADREGLAPLTGPGPRVTFLHWYRQWLDEVLKKLG